ncbi:MAG: FMN-binding negative transcriptional regulator, partial [Planctomycetota bacterium]|nr:FMN-binding negative transcriptional regulator [Planctomycetota bacterium]
TAHIARSNRQWREIAGQTVLAVFSGPHAHITPAWYETNQAVPTWNYTAVHAYGQVEVIEQPEELWSIVQQTVATYEGGRADPWSTAGDEAFARGLLSQIVGLRLKINRLEGKFKLSQNHPVERREKVVAGLEQQGDENSLGVAELMRKSLARE